MPRQLADAYHRKSTVAFYPHTLKTIGNFNGFLRQTASSCHKTYAHMYLINYICTYVHMYIGNLKYLPGKKRKTMPKNHFSLRTHKYNCRYENTYKHTLIHANT